MEKIKIENQSVGPFPAMIVGADVNGKANYAAVGAGGCACLEPVLCVSLKNTHYTTKGIRENGYFSINIPSADLVNELDYCGLVSGADVDKSRVFTAFYEENNSTPMAEECPLNFLCKVCDEKEIRGFTMFFGEIVAVYVNEDCLSNGRVNPVKINPIVMMSFSYCNLNDVIGQPFVAGKNI